MPDIKRETSIPIIIANKFELGTKYPKIGNGDEGSVYNYNYKYALKTFSLFSAMEYFYGEQLKRKFAKVEAMTLLKDEAFCYPIGLLQSDETTKKGCFFDLVHYDEGIKDFNYLKQLKDEKRILEYLLKADEAIQRAHKKGIIIGDIKENNIMIDINDNIKFVDTDNYAYQDFDFDLAPVRSKSLEMIYGHPFSRIDNDIFVFSMIALKLLTHDDSFSFSINKDYLTQLIGRLNISAEVKDGLKIIFSDAENKPYISHVLKK